MSLREADRVRREVIKLKRMKNISAIFQLCTNTAVYKQLGDGNFEKGHNRLRLAETELAEKWDAFMPLGRTVRKRITGRSVCVLITGDHFIFIETRAKSQEQCSLIKKDVAFAERCFLTRF